jgi:hypothetical protein
VKVTVSVCRKVGRPNFGSEGASCEITLDVPDDHPEVLTAQVAWAYATADASVTEQLAKSAVSHCEPMVTQPAPQPARGTWDDRHPNQRREPDSREHDGWPRSGRELYPFARKREESGQCPGLIKRLVGYGRAVGHPDRIADWNRDQVEQALRSVLPAYDEAPAGSNGYSH